MKNLTKMMAVGLLTAGLAACSNEDELPVKGDQSLNEGDKVYVSLNLNFPSTRATTNEVGNPGVEIGTSDENKVAKVQIILTNGKKVVSSDFIQGGEITGPTDQTNNKRFTCKFAANELKSLAGQTVKVYAVCNGQLVNTTDLKLDKKALTQTAYNKEQYLNNESYWKAGNFLMANKNAASDASLPDESAMRTQHTTPEKAINLGNVEVERAAARFDYKLEKENNIYPVTSEVDKSSVFAKVDLNGITLANISKEFYTFVRSNDGGLTNVDTPVLGEAKPFIVDVDWDNVANSMTTTNMIQPTTVTPDINTGVGCYVNYTYSDLDVLSTSSKNDNWEGLPQEERNEYKVWTYAPENTLPKDDANDLKGAATAVVFKGVITAGPNASEDLKNALKSTKPVFVYNNILLGDWDMVKKLAETNSEESVKVFGTQEAYGLFVNRYKETVLEAGEGEITPTIARAHQFVLYDVAPGTSDHEVYYYFWNMHNTDNMTYSVVRNNVYKLKVKSINKFGYPRNSSVDPKDPINPKDVYFEVSVDVLPWAVRVNDIEF